MNKYKLAYLTCVDTHIYWTETFNQNNYISNEVKIKNVPSEEQNEKSKLHTLKRELHCTIKIFKKNNQS